jgi:pimeloyl-ACP methyl ester carboxylesterase
MSSNPLSDTNGMDFDNNILVGYKEGVTLPNHSELIAWMTLPLPGVVIFVHGVNSDGEWYRQAEQGLCKGLNARLKRGDEHLVFQGPEAGQLSPAEYLDELTPEGFINPKVNAESFVRTDGTFSPVIHFRWGYKASGDELQEFGRGLYLNEQNYWGGGPFANGCTNLPDLWGKGIEDELFLFLHVQHINATNDRKIYSAPPRPYFVLAALRLAKLVEAIRKKQADVPITLVCHSQGNLIGMCAAFFGDAMPEVSDGKKSGRCVGDTYVLCNSPYSLLEASGTENWTERHMQDKNGKRGRQTRDARLQTLANFFKIVRKQAACEQSEARIDSRMANKAHGFSAGADKHAHGYGLKPSTCGRVTLYCNPHDQVISVSPVQGIGWRGMSQAEINASGGAGQFCQRVFSQGYRVGVRGTYRYWLDQYNLDAGGKDVGSQKFWHPESLPVSYSVRKGWEAGKAFRGPGAGELQPISLGQVATLGLAPLFIVPLKLIGMKVNGLPPKDWQIPLEGPDLPVPFKPEAVRLGHVTENFDQGFDSPSESRDRKRPRPTDGSGGDAHVDDPMAWGKGMPLGDEQSEATLQYETHAAVRMQAKRDGLYASKDQVEGEDRPSTATDDYKKWRSHEIRSSLEDNVDTHATDHSTIVTNGMHAEMAMAYDVAIGVCDIRNIDWRQLRMAADWRFVEGLADTDPQFLFREYFRLGKFQEKSIYEWSRDTKEGEMSPKIIDERGGSIILSLGKIL